jgi:hypothetical protein
MQVFEKTKSARQAAVSDPHSSRLVRGWRVAAIWSLACLGIGDYAAVTSAVAAGPAAAGGAQVVAVNPESGAVLAVQPVCKDHFAAWWQVPGPSPGCPGYTGWSVTSAPLEDASTGRLCLYHREPGTTSSAPPVSGATALQAFGFGTEPPCRVPAQAAAQVTPNTRGDGGFPKKTYYRAGQLLVLVSGGPTLADAKLIYNGGSKAVNHITLVPGSIKLIPIAGIPAGATVSSGTLKWGSSLAALALM